jgi:hypothetical protein
MDLRKKWQVALVTLVAADLVLLASDRRVLIHEHLDLIRYRETGEVSRGTLTCSYFTGRSMRSTQLNYAANNYMGRDQCPFIDRPNRTPDE